MLKLDVLPCERQQCRRRALTFRCPSEDFRIGFGSGCKSLGERRLVRDYIPDSPPVSALEPDLASTDAFGFGSGPDNLARMRSDGITCHS